MDRVFNYDFSNGEYVIYLDDEIFCHLGESDFNTFMKMCRLSGNDLLRRI